MSFEVFPPKSETPFEPIRRAVARLALQKPSFMSVTYGTSGNAQANTAEIAAFVEGLGVSLTDTLLMVPSKSVSAVVGVKRAEPEGQLEGCR